MNVDLEDELDTLRECYEMRSIAADLGFTKAAASHDADAEAYTADLWERYERSTWGRGGNR